MMLNRTAWRYLSSSRRVGPNVLVCVDNPTAWLRARPAVPARTTSASTNPASCAFFFRRFDRHASSSSSPRSETPPHLPSLGDSKWSMRETSPLTPSTATESSDPRDDDELEGALAEPLLPAEQLSWKDRAKTFASEYGRVGIATHIVLSVMSITVIYTVISCGVDVSGLLKWLGVSTNSAEKDSTAASAGSFVLAYAVYKVAAPLRWPLTFAVTPVVLRALRRRGYMLPKTKANEHRSPRPNAAEHPESGDDYSSPRQ